MSWVVFLRAANVGKHNRFQPGVLAKELAEFDVVNIGAVGTFVVREDVSEKTLRAVIAQKLPFKCDMMICPAKAIVDLAQDDPIRGAGRGEIEAYVTMMAKRPATLPKLPIYAPGEDNWEIKIVRIVGTAVVSLRRKLKNGRLYPNGVIEKKFGVATTTRHWNTITKVAKILEHDKGR